MESILFLVTILLGGGYAWHYAWREKTLSADDADEPRVGINGTYDRFNIFYIEICILENPLKAPFLDIFFSNKFIIFQI